MRTLTICACLVALCLASPTEARTVFIERVPDGGIQPLMTSDEAGTLRLVYFVAAGEDTRLGRLLYRERTSGSEGWSEPVVITPQPYRHTDAIGRADIAVDGAGRLHVTWFNASPPAYYYTKSDMSRTRFASPREVVTEHLDGVEAASSIATDGERVTISWHAGDMVDEASRQVYAVTSTDGGRTFGPEIAVSDQALGVCGCCCMETGYLDGGEFVLAYRSAIDGKGRHMQLMKNGTTTSVDDWVVEYCPVTSNAAAGDWLVFETEGTIMEARLTGEGGTRAVARSSSTIRQKHPAIAVNGDNERLIAWGEGNGYTVGGGLALRLFDAGGDSLAPEIEGRREATIPDYSFVAVSRLPNDDFLVLY